MTISDTTRDRCCTALFRLLAVAAFAIATAAAAPSVGTLVPIPSTGVSPFGSDGFTAFGLVDWDRDGNADIIARDGADDLWLYPGDSKRAYSTAARVKIGNGWKGYTPFGAGDWDKDGNADLVAVDRNGDMMLFPGQSKRGYSMIQPVKIGNGWAGFTPAGLADWDNDGNPDLLAIDRSGLLWLYLGEGRRGYSQAGRVQIGNGWRQYRAFGVADWDRDGKIDLIARDPANDLWLYPGEARRGLSRIDRVKIGNGWGGYVPFGAADWDGDGSPDIVARAGNRDLMLFPGQSKRGYSMIQPVKIGNGW